MKTRCNGQDIMRGVYVSDMLAIYSFAIQSVSSIRLTGQEHLKIARKPVSLTCVIFKDQSCVI